MSNYAQIRNIDISNGYGIGVGLFFSGCDFHCKNCFNSELWDYNYGNPFTNNELEEIITLMNNPHISRLSILGGDGLMDKNLNDTFSVVKKVKEYYPNKKIWLYTGYTFEEIMNIDKHNDNSILRKEILNYIDFLVDGQFQEDKKDLNLKFRGSSNQRIWKKDKDGNWKIDIKE